MPVFLASIGIVIFALCGLQPLAAAESGGRILVTRVAIAALTKLPPSPDAKIFAGFYEHYRPYLEAHNGTTNFTERNDAVERSKNFIDLDALGTAPLFAEIPHSETEALKKFEASKLRAAGTAPWALAEQYQELTYAFQDRDLPAILFHSARLGTYTYELLQPFHLTQNYNGQQTGQYGIHNRFEGLPEQHKMIAADLKPNFPTLINNPTEAAFIWAIASYAQVAPILDADKAARIPMSGKKPDDLFAEKALPITQTLLSSAATNLASLYYSAWIRAGHPALPSEINPAKTPTVLIH